MNNNYDSALLIPYCEKYIYQNGDTIPYIDLEKSTSEWSVFDNGDFRRNKMIAGILPNSLQKEMNCIESVMDVLYFDNETKQFYEYGLDSNGGLNSVEKRILSEEGAFHKLCYVSQMIASGVSPEHIPVFTEQAVQALKEGGVKSIYTAFEHANFGKIRVPFIADETVLRNLGVFNEISACSSAEERIGIVQNRLNNMVKEFGKLQNMGLIHNGCVDFDKLDQIASANLKDDPESVLQYAKDFAGSFAEVIVERAETETDKYATRKNSYGITEYTYIGNVFAEEGEFTDDAEFDFEHNMAYLPLKPLTDEEMARVDPKNMIASDESMFMLVLDCSSRTGFPEMKIAVTANLGRDRLYPLNFDAACSILDSFKYEICAHDKNKDTYFVCALSNNRKEAYYIAEFAFDCNSAKAEDNKTSEIDEIAIIDKSNNCKIVSIDKKGFHHVNSNNKYPAIEK